MDLRLASAIVASIVLVGGALWSRSVVVVKNNQPNIIAVEQPWSSEDDYKEILSEFSKPKTASTTVSTKPLNSVDIVGRKLIFDYVNLAASGQANEATVARLANNEATQISQYHTFEKATIKDVIIVQDSEANARKYGTELAKIYATYAQNMATLSKNMGSTKNFTLAKNVYAVSAAKISKDTVSVFKGLAVPLSLSNLHLAIINNHLSNAAAMESVSKMEEDPLKTMAGLMAITENANKEAVILEQMRELLRRKWGLI